MSELFPELDAEPAAPAKLPQTPNLQPAGPAPPTPPQQTANLRPPPPARSARALFDKLLGLPGRFAAGGGCRVRFVEYPEPERVRLDLQGGGVPLFTLYLLRGAADPAFARTRHLSLIVAGVEIPPITQRLLQQLAAHLADTTFPMLQRIVAADPSVALPTALAQSTEPPPPERIDTPAVRAAGTPDVDGATMPAMSWPPTDVDEEYLDSLGFGYSPPGAWRNFHQGHENNYGGIENARGYCQHMAGNVVTVNHTEIECYYSSPPQRDGAVAFWNHVQPDRDYRRPGTDHLEFFSDLSDIDVIKGGTPKLDRLLASIADSGRNPEYVVLTRTCTTTVIGDDTQGSIERVKRRLPIKPLDMGLSRDVKATLFDDARANPEWLSTPKTPGAFNLVGFPDMPGHHEFLELLTGAGLSLNAWILPAIDVEQIKRYLRAESQILFDWPALDRSYQTMLAGLPIQTIRPPAPFGLEGTRRFLLAIADALGNPSMFEDTWQRRHDHVRPAWDALVREARGYRVGFIGEERTLTRFFALKSLLGIPVLDFLDEMGFGVDLYMIRTRGPAPDPKLTVEGSLRTRYFESAAELEDILSTTDTAAFYSELYFDRRLTRSGRNLFSIKDLGRIGIGGALQALQSMVTACRMPFYRTYAKYLGRPFAVGHEHEAADAG